MEMNVVFFGKENNTLEGGFGKYLEKGELVNWDKGGLKRKLMRSVTRKSMGQMGESVKGPS